MLEEQASNQEEKKLELAYDKATRALAIDAIDMNSFADLYDPSKIREDINKVNETNKKFAHDQEYEQEQLKRRATIFEAILHQQVELAEWFGEGTFTIKPSTYDDIFNGVDTIVEFQKESSTSYLALGIDVTTSQMSIQKKFDRIRDEIEQGRLAVIKYFQSKHAGYRGELQRVPRVVVGLDGSHTNKLIDLWMADNNKELGRSKLQYILLNQIKLQLNAFADFAQKIGKSDLANIYRLNLAIVNDIIAQKEPEFSKHAGSPDRVTDMIKTDLEQFKYE